MCPSFRSQPAIHVGHSWPANPEAALNPLLEVSEPVEVMKALGAGEEALMWDGGMEGQNEEGPLRGIEGYRLTSRLAQWHGTSPREVVMSQP